VRGDTSTIAQAAETAVIGDIATLTDWNPVLRGVEAVVHAAARAHVMGDAPGNSQLYLDANAHATRRLAAAAVQCGIRRFIYLSSIKVNGEETSGAAYTSGDAPHPRDPYGVSKLLAEQSVLELSGGAGMRAAIVRPPLVYGPGVRANFLRLMSWVDRGRPLPLGAVNNRRSLVSIWNLCDLLRRLLEDPLPSGRVWLVSDAEDLSTPDLIRRIAAAMGRKPRLVPIAPAALRFAATLIGKRAEIARLCGSLRVDMTPTRNDLAWSPPVTVKESLERTVRWYLESR
jgi:UDP-4-keto-D-QuiNAc 4-reductase